MRGELVFTCPACGHPSAQTVEPDVDIHSGATYTCDECAGKVVFTAQTVEEYCAVSAPVSDRARRRDMFAAAAMTGLLSPGDYMSNCRAVADAIEIADILLAELDRVPMEEGEA